MYQKNPNGGDTPNVSIYSNIIVILWKGCLDC